MTDITRLEQALVAADAAGDTQAAQQLAAEIRRQRGMQSMEHTQTGMQNRGYVQRGLKNVGAEALGGITDLAGSMRMPVPLVQPMMRYGIEQLNKVVPTEGDPAFHDSPAGRAVRWAAPAAAFPGQSPMMAGVNALAAGLGGAIDYQQEQAGAPTWQRLMLALSPTIAAGGLAGATKFALRGGPAKGEEMARNIAGLEAQGIKDFAVSQVAPEGNTRLPTIEKASSFAFFGSGEFQRLGKKQEPQLKALAARIAGGSADDAEAAGKGVWRGLFDQGTGWSSRAVVTERGLWAPIDQAIGGHPLYGTSIKPTHYEQALKDIVGTFDSPNQAAAFGGDKAGAAERLAALAADGGTMTFNDFKEARRAIGDAMSGRPGVPSERGLSDRQAAKLWGALMEDYKDLASATGVQNEFAAARGFSKNYHETSRNFFKNIFGKEAEPTTIIDEIASGNYQHPAKLRALRDALAPEEFRGLQEYVINRMGTPSGSKLGAFSLETFYTNYNNRFAGAGKAGKAAADAMFGKIGTPTRDAMETLFRFAEKTKQGSQLLYNTSGTAGAGIAGASLMAILGDLSKKSAAMIAGAGIGGGVAATGAVAGSPGIAGGVIAGGVANNVLAKMLTSPRFSRWLSRTMFQDQARLPSSMVVLMNTPLESDDLEQAKKDFLNVYDQFRMTGAAP